MSQSNQDNDNYDAHATAVYRCEDCDETLDELVWSDEVDPDSVICGHCGGEAPKVGVHHCELCDGETEELTLTSDSHPEGVNYLVCEECSA